MIGATILSSLGSVVLGGPEAQQQPLLLCSSKIRDVPTCEANLNCRSPTTYQ